jgi:putative ABC transport system permease protein
LNLRLLGAAAFAGGLTLVMAFAVGGAQLPVSLGAAKTGRDRRRTGTRAVLLVIQTALSVMLLAGAGLFARSLYNLAHQDFGMTLHGVLLVQFEQGPGSAPDQQELFASAIDRIRALPGVELATPIKTLPFTGFNVPPIGVPGMQESPSVNGQLPFLTASTPELLKILGIEIVRGRPFSDADDRGAPVVIVNETMARALWPGESALGKCIRIGFDPSFDPFTASGPPGPPVNVPCREVVGVARDIRQRSVLPGGIEAKLMQYFVPFSQVPPPPGGVGTGPGIQGLLLRAGVGPDVLAGPIRRLVMGSRTDLPFLHVRRYAELLERQMRPWRVGTMLLSLFGALALVVAALGLYSAFAYSVSERRHEMAIRIAIGARPGGVLVMILREAAGLAAIGVLAGSIATLIAGRWLQSMLFGTAPSDPVVLVSAAVLMIAVALLATLLPARNASRTDPNSLLRAE